MKFQYFYFYCLLSIATPCLASDTKNKTPLKSILKQSVPIAIAAPTEQSTSPQSIVGRNSESEVYNKNAYRTPKGSRIKLTATNSVLLNLTRLPASSEVMNLFGKQPTENIDEKTTIISEDK